MKEKLERDALNRIRWDKTFNPEDFEILFVDSSADDLKKVNFSEIKIEGDFMRIDESLIPMHRIRKILYKGEVVWDKRK